MEQPGHREQILKGNPISVLSKLSIFLQKKCWENVTRKLCSNHIASRSDTIFTIHTFCRDIHPISAPLVSIGFVPFQWYRLSFIGLLYLRYWTVWTQYGIVLYFCFYCDFFSHSTQPCTVKKELWLWINLKKDYKFHVLSYSSIAFMTYLSCYLFRGKSL